MKVKDVMTRMTYTCTPEQTLNEAARWMWEKDCGSVPVVTHDDQVVGLLTDRDICIAAYTTGASLHEVPVSRAMSKRLVSCSAEQSIDTAIKLMAENKVRRLPVLDADGKLEGILSINDVSLAPQSTSGKQRHSLREKIAEALARICEHRPAVIQAQPKRSVVACRPAGQPATAPSKAASRTAQKAR